jgi:fatty acid desaturase
MSTADPMARLMVEDRARVRAALREAGIGIRDLQAPDARHAARYLLTAWLAAAAAAVAWRALDGAWALLLVPALGVIQHVILNIVHEASHQVLLPGRRLNDRVADLLAALPIAHTVASYRLTQVDHHAYLRTPRDPSGYVTRPDLTAGGIRRTLLFLLCGRLAWELAARSLLGRRLEAEAAAERAAMQATDRRRLVAVALWQAPVAAACWATGLGGFWLAWIATLLTVTPTLDGIRTLVEHRALPGSAAPFHTRSHHVNALLSGLAAPFFQYHWEHHLFPAVPHHRLAELHRLLVARDVPGARPPDGGFLRVLARVA